MEELPNEIFFDLARSLDLFDLARCKRVNRKFRTIFTYLLNQRLKKMPWSIVVDFARDRNHHLQLNQAWVKIGWFTQRSLLHNDINDVFEYCEKSASARAKQKFVLTQSGNGGPILLKILACRRGSLSLTKDYCPLIELSRTQKEDPRSIPVKFVKGEEIEPEKYLLIQPSDEVKEIVQRYDPYILYRNRTINWYQAFREL
jgi:hypothetical protein